MAYGVLPFYTPDPADTLAARGVVSAERAIALDSTLADAYLGLASSLAAENRPHESLPLQVRAVALAPNDPTSHQWLGDDLLLLGRVDEGVAELRRAVAMDPLSSVMHHDLAIALVAARRYGDAIAAARRSSELEPADVGQRPAGALAHVFAGQADSAVALLAPTYARSPDAPGVQAVLGLAYAALGRWSELDRLVADAARRGGDRSAGVEPAVLALATGDRAPMLRVLRTSAGQRAWVTRFYTLGCSPILDPLQSEPIFLSILAQQGIDHCPVTTAWPIRPRARASSPPRVPLRSRLAHAAPNYR
jgi:tetratricopeptide (TPR) repeat protein